MAQLAGNAAESEREFLRRVARNLDRIGRAVEQSDHGSVRISMPTEKTVVETAADFHTAAERLRRIADRASDLLGPDDPGRIETT